MSTYAYGSRLDDDSFAITYIDEDTSEAVTKGEINGEPFESSGGGGGGAEPLIVNESNSFPPTLDRTWQEICDAFPNVYIKKITSFPSSDDQVSMYVVCELGIVPASQDTTSYIVWRTDAGLFVEYATNSADGYPEEQLE